MKKKMSLKAKLSLYLGRILFPNEFMDDKQAERGDAFYEARIKTKSTVIVVKENPLKALFGELYRQYGKGIFTNSNADYTLEYVAICAKTSRDYNCDRDIEKYIYRNSKGYRKSNKLFRLLVKQYLEEDKVFDKIMCKINKEEFFITMEDIDKNAAVKNATEKEDNIKPKENEPKKNLSKYLDMPIKFEISNGHYTIADIEKMTGRGANYVITVCKNNSCVLYAGKTLRDVFIQIEQVYGRQIFAMDLYTHIDKEAHIIRASANLGYDVETGDFNTKLLYETIKGLNALNKQFVELALQYLVEAKEKEAKEQKEKLERIKKKFVTIEEVVGEE